MRRDPDLPRLIQRPSNSAYHRFEPDTASGVSLRIEEDLDVTNALVSRTRQVGGRELVEIPFVDEHRARLVIHIQERLQVAEPIRPPDRIRVGIRQADTVAPSKLEHQLRLE